VLGSYVDDAHARADVFIPVSIQTEREGHYTNFANVVSAFRPCFRKNDAVAHAEALFAELGSA
jgi:NADH-quinone oxidoreductase subunit G